MKLQASSKYGARFSLRLSDTGIHFVRNSVASTFEEGEGGGGGAVVVVTSHFGSLTVDVVGLLPPEL